MPRQDATFYAESKQRALQIPDMKTALEVMKLMQINAKGLGLKSKDEAIDVIVGAMSKMTTADTPRKSEAATTGLRKAILEDDKYRSKLLSKYDMVHKLYNSLPEKYRNDLNKVFQDIVQKFESKKAEIRKRECSILIVGETAAGKSSLINMLLGVTDLMPTSELGCTTTICELRSNKDGRKEAKLHPRLTASIDENSKRHGPIVLDLRCEAGFQRFQKAVTDSDEDGISMYEKIEVTWPFPMLEDGLVIVDTPGIGGDGQMTSYVEEYLSKSYGFIYVVNSANAGGIQKGRLQNFMRIVLNAASEEGFDSTSTIVICNKWDKVPEQDRTEVKEDTYQKLSQYFTDLTRSQLHYMSLTEAEKAVRCGTSTHDYASLLQMVEQLLPNSLSSRLHAHYRWLTAVLKRMIYILKVSKVMQTKSMARVKEDFQQIKLQIERLQQNSKDSINYLKAGINGESAMVAQRIVETLVSHDMLTRLYDWRPEQLVMEDKKKVATEALEKIANRVTFEMNVWERENSIVTGIKEKIIAVCKKDFELMENQIAKIEGKLLGGDNKIVRDLHRSLKQNSKTKQKLQTKDRSAVDMDTIKGLGGAVVSASAMKPSDKHFKKIFSDFKLKDPNKCVTKMRDAMKLFVDSILNSKLLRDKMHAFFSRYVNDIDAVAKMIPDFLKADIELMEILREQLTDTETNLRQVFPTLLRDSSLLLGQLDMFFVKSIFTFDYSMTDLIWDQSAKAIGHGTFADVYLANIKTSRQEQLPVALKVCRDPLNEATISDVLLEDRTLRELDHPNIVSYHGATFRFENVKKQKGMQWIMIMEICKHTMKKKFLQTKENNPGKFGAGSKAHKHAMIMMADFALQLCSGLHYLHDKGFVHRDLKLENILVTERNTVKLTDVGLTKQATDIASSVVGSPVYMAPEVLLMSQNYDHKADIYSLAIIFWEMWYGLDVAVYIHHNLVGTLEDTIRSGLRPPLHLPTEPPENWKNLIDRSWDSNPDNRPNADVHCQLFRDFLHS